MKGPDPNNNKKLNFTMTLVDRPKMSKEETVRRPDDQTSLRTCLEICPQTPKASDSSFGHKKKRADSCNAINQTWRHGQKKRQLKKFGFSIISLVSRNDVRAEVNYVQLNTSSKKTTTQNSTDDGTLILSTRSSQWPRLKSGKSMRLETPVKRADGDYQVCQK